MIERFKRGLEVVTNDSNWKSYVRNESLMALAMSGAYLANEVIRRYTENTPLDVPPMIVQGFAGFSAMAIPVALALTTAREALRYGRFQVLKGGLESQ